MINKEWSTSKLPDGTLLIKKYLGNEKNIIVPSVINGKNVSVIGKRALADIASDTKTVFIEDGIKVIESSMILPILAKEFEIEKIRIPDSVVQIDSPLIMKQDIEIECNPGTYANYYANEHNYKTSKKIELLKYVPKENEKEAIIDDKYYILSRRAFSNCKELKHVVLSRNLYDIAKESAFRADGAFSGCDLLKTVGPAGSGCDIEYNWNGLIPNSAFYGSEVNTIYISKEIYSVGDYAFYGCGKNPIFYVSGYFRVGYHSFPEDAKIFLEDDNCPIDPSIKHLVVKNK